MSLARRLFRAGSILTTLKIVASGNPVRIFKHLFRRQAHKTMGKELRKW